LNEPKSAASRMCTWHFTTSSSEEAGGFQRGRDLLANDVLRFQANRQAFPQMLRGRRASCARPSPILPSAIRPATKT
jgi:hypothetical protein